MKDGILVTTVVPGLMRTGSPRNADFKGQNDREYAWFSISDSLPFLSMDADRAAQRILHAAGHGEVEVTLTFPARAASIIDTLFPEFTGSLFAAANRLLPGPGGIGTRVAKGKESTSAASPSLGQAWVIALQRATTKSVSASPCQRKPLTAIEECANPNHPLLPFGIHEVVGDHVAHNHVRIFDASHVRHADIQIQLRDRAQFTAIASGESDRLATDRVRVFKRIHDVRRVARAADRQYDVSLRTRSSSTAQRTRSHRYVIRICKHRRHVVAQRHNLELVVAFVACAFHDVAYEVRGADRAASVSAGENMASFGAGAA